MVLWETVHELSIILVQTGFGTTLQDYYNIYYYPI